MPRPSTDERGFALLYQCQCEYGTYSDDADCPNGFFCRTAIFLPIGAEYEKRQRKDNFYEPFRKRTFETNLKKLAPKYGLEPAKVNSLE